MIALSNADLSLKFRAMATSLCVVAQQWFAPVLAGFGGGKTVTVPEDSVMRRGCFPGSQEVAFRDFARNVQVCFIKRADP
ncbi:hypothetical protein SAMN04488078_11198 [Antarctobacter heliothermus]|uniref:Uncharacterized protein n=1 Tax=Antarctobacter heliothermus TaxID=74033 RepID=A0A239M6D3_9RHOB|nr:hypothetical protein SAMN04488078_11198 [Antarctobacter heliothermus]